MSLKPTLEEYKAIGKELAFLRERLSTLTNTVAHKTGISKAPYKHIQESLKQLDICKSESEELMFLQYPELGREGIKIFYHKVHQEEE